MVWATVDVDLSEIDEDILIRHLVARGYVVRDKFEADNPELDARIDTKAQLSLIHEALYLGKQDEAMYLMSNYVANTLGRVL
jgi:hypothetical protein